MQRVEGTDLFHASFELAPDARLQYQFVRDLGDSMIDPRNPRSSDSLFYPGSVSLLVMPEADAPPISTDAERNGVVEALPFETSKKQVGRLTWGGERPVSVYLPEGYDPSSPVTYPSMSVLYGKRMLDSARLDQVLDELTGRTIEPVIAVFVHVISGYEYARSQRDEHARMLVDALVPLFQGCFDLVERGVPIDKLFEDNSAEERAGRPWVTPSDHHPGLTRRPNGKATEALTGDERHRHRSRVAAVHLLEWRAVTDHELDPSAGNDARRRGSLELGRVLLQPQCLYERPKL